MGSISSNHPRRPVALLAALAIACAGLVAACSSSATAAPATTAPATAAPAATAPATAAPAATAPAASSSRVFHFVLSNNFLGNDFRPEVEKIAQLTMALPPFAGRATLQIVNSENTDEAQIASLNNIISSKPDAILIDAGSATALNPSIANACAAGIVVVVYDQTVTAPCAWNVSIDYGLAEQVAGQWMAHILNSQGSVFIDGGLANAPISKVISDGFEAGLHKYGPNIKIVGTFYGGYNKAQTQQGVAGVLVAHPDVNGILDQGYCTAGFAALQAAGKKPVPSSCFSYMGELVTCAEAGHQCAVVSNAPDMVQVALKLALDAVEGNSTPPKTQTVEVPLTLYVTDASNFQVNVPGVTIEQIKLGVNAFPNLAPGLGTPFTLPQYPISAQQLAGS